MMMMMGMGRGGDERAGEQVLPSHHLVGQYIHFHVPPALNMLQPTNHDESNAISGCISKSSPRTDHSDWTRLDYPLILRRFGLLFISMSRTDLDGCPALPFQPCSVPFHRFYLITIKLFIIFSWHD
jgi:hypothetical protein